MTSRALLKNSCHSNTSVPDKVDYPNKSKIFNDSVDEISLATQNFKQILQLFFSMLKLPDKSIYEKNFVKINSPG